MDMVETFLKSPNVRGSSSFEVNAGYPRKSTPLSTNNQSNISIFSSKHINLGAEFYFYPFFIAMIFDVLYFPIMCPIFVGSVDMKHDCILNTILSPLIPQIWQNGNFKFKLCVW